MAQEALTIIQESTISTTGCRCNAWPSSTKCKRTPEAQSTMSNSILWQVAPNYQMSSFTACHNCQQLQHVQSEKFSQDLTTTHHTRICRMHCKLPKTLQFTRLSMSINALLSIGQQLEVQSSCLTVCLLRFHTSEKD